MLKLAIALTVVMGATPAFAETLTCWYDRDGNFSSSQPGNKINAVAWAGDHCGFAVQACSDPANPSHEASEGDQAWAYVITQYQTRDDGLGPCLIFLSKVYEMRE